MLRILWFCSTFFKFLFFFSFLACAHLCLSRSPFCIWFNLTSFIKITLTWTHGPCLLSHSPIRKSFFSPLILPLFLLVSLFPFLFLSLTPTYSPLSSQTDTGISVFPRDARFNMAAGKGLKTKRKKINPSTPIILGKRGGGGQETVIIVYLRVY